MRDTTPKTRRGTLPPVAQAILGLSGIIFGVFLLVAGRSLGGVFFIALSALSILLAGVRSRDNKSKPKSNGQSPQHVVSPLYLVFAFSFIAGLSAYSFFLVTYYRSRGNQGMAFLAFVGGCLSFSLLALLIGSWPARRRFAKGKAGPLA